MRIVKGPYLIDIALTSSLARVVGVHTEFIKPQRHKVNRERLHLFMRKRGDNSIIKWKMHFFL